MAGLPGAGPTRAVNNGWRGGSGWWFTDNDRGRWVAGWVILGADAAL